MHQQAARPPKIPQSVLVVIHTAELDALLIERADAPGTWQSVTGSKDTLSEEWAETACREVAEETGIVIGSAAVPRHNLVDWQHENDYEIYERWRHRYAPGVTRNTERVFSLLVPRGIEVTLAPREHLQFEWLPHDLAARRCFSPSNIAALLQLPQRGKRS